MTQAAPNEEWNGAVLGGRYKVGRCLGSGGMGSVHAATDMETGQQVAIKLVHAEYLGDPGVIERFLDEARTGQKFSHPNIVRVFGTGRLDDNRPFMVMELLEGVPLSAYTKNGGRVPVPQAASILQAVLSGLAVAHAEGIVHRDLKPENVFLSRDPNGQFVVKILDFGIAKVMEVAGGMGKRTRTGMLLGTPAYMSPEQIKNSKDVDPRSDLFSLGVLFYEMLTGRPAFPAVNEFAKLTAVLSVEPEPLDRIDPNLAFLMPFVARAIHKDRQQRFQSAMEMLHALGTTLGQDVHRQGARAHALSHLPEVPQMPTARVAASPFVGATPDPRRSPVPVVSVVPVGGTPVPGALPFDPRDPSLSEARRRLLETPISSSDTLKSARGVQVANEPPPQVLMAPPPPLQPSSQRGEARGVAPWVVACLVAAALIAGFVLGLAVGHAL